MILETVNELYAEVHLTAHDLHHLIVALQSLTGDCRHMGQPKRAAVLETMANLLECAEREIELKRNLYDRAQPAARKAVR